jgi:hypothetical protein
MKTIILIPYRKRKKQLKYFIKNTAPLLKEKIENLEILIIKQGNNKKFNRGKILNVGYNFYNNPNYYYITQDIDINPIHESSLNQYNRIIDKSILRIYSSKFNTLGGIIKFRGDIFKKLNGFPNDYWGWGLEDKNLLNRANYNKIDIITFILSNNNKKNIYFKIFDDVNDRNPINNKKLRKLNYKEFNLLNEEKKKEYIFSSGLNNLDYNLIYEKNINEYIKKIKVDI